MRRELLIAASGAVASSAAVGIVGARRWWRTWGHDPAEGAELLAGDDLIATAEAVDTRGITIEAPPEDVWPWLVQMGYGRAGWYSYDVLDMKGKSSVEIVSELQSLAVGDTVPTDPGGGFAVKALEPGQSLVLYADTELMAGRTTHPSEGTPAGVAASGKVLEVATPPEFRVSWAFVVRPLADGRTRLIERVRLHAETTQPGLSFMTPILGFGVFVMMQRQMRGIRERAERLARAGAPIGPAVVPA
jgi:hypothetical protein